MKIEMRYRRFWLRALLLLPVLLMLLCVGCSRDEEVEPTINIYVYAPDRASVTRGEVVPTLEEGRIYNLQIWVFRSSDPTQKVASLTITKESELQGLNEEKSASFSLKLSDRSFADRPEPVDIYVMANVLDNNGTNYLEDVTSGAEIEEAVFNGGHFFSFKTGPTYQAATSVPQGLGIPLSGVARGKSVIDRNNVLHVNDANLRLVRTVSKIRFVFSSLEGLDPIFIENITLNKNMLYRKERFFLDGDHPNYWVEEPFDPSVQVRLVKGDNNIPVVQNADPTVYAHNSKYSDEEYETLVNNGVEDRMLTEYGPVYLPESDKRLSGTISFRIGYYSNNTLEAPFSMATGNFHRNQTWLVYAYYIGSSKLVVSAVNVVPWEIVDDLPDHQVPNW